MAVGAGEKSKKPLGLRLELWKQYGSTTNSTTGAEVNLWAPSSGSSASAEVNSYHNCS